MRGSRTVVKPFEGLLLLWCFSPFILLYFTTVVLGEVAWAISRTKDNYLSAYYHRIARRRGKKKAIVALEHKVLVIIYHVLRTKKPYADLGADYFDQRDRLRIERHHIHRLEQLGYTVTLTTKEAV